MEFLQNVAGTLRFPGPGDDPVAFEANPTITVTRHSDGSAIATAAATSKVEEGDDVYFTFDLTGADLPEVDLLIAVWTADGSSYTTYTEVVGGFACSLKAIAKKYDEGGPSNDDFAAAREAATTQIEGACGVAFRPRYGKEVLDGSGSRELLLRQPKLLRVLSVSVAGETVDPDGLTVDPLGVVLSPFRWAEGRSNVEIAYVHGYESYGPAGLPVCDLAAYLLTTSPTDWNQRATSVSTEKGSYSLVTPGVRGASFPLPVVNAFVEDNFWPSVG